jgi:hypothetical protein
MTKEQFKQATNKYKKLLSRFNIAPQEQPINLRTPNIVQTIAHVIWMCNKIEEFIDEDRTDKANRWLGFVQGVCWLYGFYTIDELCEDNKAGL